MFPIARLAIANPLVIAARAAIVLNHGCAPQGVADYKETKDLMAAMVAAKEAYEEEVPFFCPCPLWGEGQDAEGRPTLEWCSFGGGMTIMTSKEEVRFELYTPAYAGGKEPFFTLTVKKGGQAVAGIVPTACTTLFREGAEEFSYVEELSQAIWGKEGPLKVLSQRDEFLWALCELKEARRELALAAFEGDIECYPEVMRSRLERARERLAKAEKGWEEVSYGLFSPVGEGRRVKCAGWACSVEVPVRFAHIGMTHPIYGRVIALLQAA